MSARGRKNADPAIAAHLAAGKSQADAARAAGVSPRTVQRRVADPEFMKLVGRYRAQLFHAATGRIASLNDKAADELEKLLKNKSANVRLSAVRMVFDVGMRLWERVELADQLAELQDGRHASVVARAGEKDQNEDGEGASEKDTEE
jgi:hypothetical protein